MTHFLVYKELCLLIGQLGLMVVPSALWRNSTPLKRGQFYNVVKDLIEVGAVLRVKRGYYKPCDVYQWSFGDVDGKAWEGGENE